MWTQIPFSLKRTKPALLLFLLFFTLIPIICSILLGGWSRLLWLLQVTGVQTSPFSPCLKHLLATHWSMLKCSALADRYLQILPHLPVLENFLSPVTEVGPANYCLPSSSQGYHLNQGPEARHLFFNHLRLPIFGGMERNTCSRALRHLILAWHQTTQNEPNHPLKGPVSHRSLSK